MSPGLILVGLGLVLVIEGLVLALAPALYDEIVEFVRRMPVETRRRAGLVAVVAGVALIWLGRL